MSTLFLGNYVAHKTEVCLQFSLSDMSALLNHEAKNLLTYKGRIKRSKGSNNSNKRKDSSRSDGPIPQIMWDARRRQVRGVAGALKHARFFLTNATLVRKREENDDPEEVYRIRLTYSYDRNGPPFNSLSASRYDIEEQILNKLLLRKWKLRLFSEMSESRLRICFDSREETPTHEDDLWIVPQAEAKNSQFNMVS